MHLNSCWLPATQQQNFRAILDGFARPGSEVMLGDQETEAALVFLATLLDESVTLADPAAILNIDQRRLLQASDALPQDARFIVLDGSVKPMDNFYPAVGTLESPEFGATLVLTVKSLSNHQSQNPQSLHQAATKFAENGGKSDATTLQLSGPGLDAKHQHLLQVNGLDVQWLRQRAAWVSAFPLGIDLVLCAPDRMVALPRSTKISIVQD